MRVDRGYADESGGMPPRPRSGQARDRPATPPRPPRPASRHDQDRRPPRPDQSRDRSSAPRRPAPQRGLRGALAVLGMFVVTLAGAAAESYLAVGLGLVTTVVLTGSAAIAALVVRRRDLASVVVAPPLVFVGVALVNIVLAPSASLTLPTVATLLIRGFPAMAIAATAALVITAVRLAARR